MEALDVYLSPTSIPEQDGFRWSTFAAVLRDARAVTGRSPETGAVLSESNVATWVGAMGYLAFVDQVGRAVRLKTMHPSRRARIDDPTWGANERPFRAALVQFTQLNDRHISALFALRCSLMHTFSLVNVNRHRSDLQHRFALVVGNGTLIRLPTKPWDGTFTDGRRRISATTVNVIQLGEEIEWLAMSIARAHAQQKLEIVPKNESEFLQRFTFGVTTTDPRLAQRG